jgi:hypothetical protein
MLKNIQSKINKTLADNHQYILKLVLIVSTILVLIIVGTQIYKKIYVPGTTLSLFTSGPAKPDDVPAMKRPFLNIYDDKGKKINVVLITHPFSRDECITQYNDAKAKGVEFLGISSYCEFPGIISNPHDVLHDPKHKAWTYNYFDLCRGWCHCFRDPDQYIPKDHPKLLLSESDFAKYNKHKPDTNVKKEYDFLYVCLKDNDKCEPGWQSYNRNWDEAQGFLDIMCNKFHLKGLLIGRINCKIPAGCHKLMELTDFMEYDKFIKQYNKCRFVFVPNKLDASPRVMTEAICFNLPVLGNYNITGGWKYVTPESGELFNQTPGDFEAVLKRFLKNFNTYKPREFYMREFSEEKMGRQLLDFVHQTVGKDKVNFTTEGPDAVKWLVPGI